MKRAVLVAAAFLLSACTGSHHARVHAASPATVRTAQCHDWKHASKTQRQQLVAGMREFFGGQVDSPGRRGQVLPDARAFVVFDGYCKPSYADGFALYRLYGDAAAFTRPTMMRPEG